MQWYIKDFNGLTKTELYDIIKLRVDIFVVEQNCPYPELDNKDQLAYHCFCKDATGSVIAYCRIFKPGDYFTEAAIGRVVVSRAYRNQKLGYKLMEKALAFIKNNWQNVSVKLGGQTYLEKFYGNLGFVKVGKPYIEDGIPHVYMILKP